MSDLQTRLFLNFYNSLRDEYFGKVKSKVEALLKSNDVEMSSELKTLLEELQSPLGKMPKMPETTAVVPQKPSRTSVRGGARLNDPDLNYEVPSGTTCSWVFTRGNKKGEKCTSTATVLKSGYPRCVKCRPRAIPGSRSKASAGVGLPKSLTKPRNQNSLRASDRKPNLSVKDVLKRKNESSAESIVDDASSGDEASVPEYKSGGNKLRAKILQTRLSSDDDSSATDSS
jgi:hypothetical protein